jgi:hypothetical protein
MKENGILGMLFCFIDEDESCSGFSIITRINRSDFCKSVNWWAVNINYSKINNLINDMREYGENDNFCNKKDIVWDHYRKNINVE